MTVSTMTTHLAADMPAATPNLRSATDDPPTWAARHLAELHDGEPGLMLRRIMLGLGLGSIHGFSMGLVGDVSDMAVGAGRVVFALLAVMVMAAPALQVFVALLDLPVAPLTTLERASRATFRTGLVLAGAAPAIALYATTAGADAALGLGLLTLHLGGLVGLHGFATQLWKAMQSARRWSRVGGAVILFGFATFAVVLFVRIGEHFAMGGVR
ncbi:MAG: hypothetical protein OXR73_06365 [Myxococcales bacterium]|nr:hypothetical protein [Myxococcales bacterium]